MSASEEIRETVRRRYAAAATRSGAGDHEGALVVEASCCGPAPVATTDERGRVVFGAELYGPEAHGAAGEAVAASLGCGVPTAVADLHPGEARSLPDARDIVEELTTAEVKLNIGRSVHEPNDTQAQPAQETHLVGLYRAGKHTTAELAELFTVGRPNVYRAVQRAGDVKVG